MRLTRAVTHIRLGDANHAKMAALDALAADYLRLCQAYTTYFCTEAQPEKYAAPCFDSPLSQRWQRVAIQHAAGIDVGMANFITTSEGVQYGTFYGKLAARHKRDREKRRRKAKLRKCLEKKGVKRLPSIRNLKLARRGIRARKVKSAYSSQECHECHHVARETHPTQQTFCCAVCGHTKHADVNAAENLASRLGDQELATCVDRQAIKALMDRRHQEWQDKHRLAVVQPPAQLVRQRA
jgi:transposase